MLLLIMGWWQTSGARLTALNTNGQSKDVAPCWRGQVWHKPHTCSLMLFSITRPSSGHGVNYRLLVLQGFHYSDVHKYLYFIFMSVHLVFKQGLEGSGQEEVLEVQELELQCPPEARHTHTTHHFFYFALFMFVIVWFLPHKDFQHCYPFPLKFLI